TAAPDQYPRTEEHEQDNRTDKDNLVQFISILLCWPRGRSAKHWGGILLLKARLYYWSSSSSAGNRAVKPVDLTMRTPLPMPYCFSYLPVLGRELRLAPST